MNLLRDIPKNIPRLTFNSVSLLACAYLCFSPRVAKGLYSTMLFRPYPYPEGDYSIDSINDLSYTDIYFRSKDGTLLHAWYFKQESSRQTILMSHGNTGNLSGRPNLLKALLDTGASIFIYDYRGYGRSQGKPSVEGLIQDGCAAFDYLCKENLASPENIILYGESLGAAISCQIAKRRNPKGLILQSGFASLPKIGRVHVPLMHLYPAFLFPQPLLDNIDILKKKHPPLLILHGHKDIVVPYSHAQELYKHATGKKQLLSFPEAGHSDMPTLSPEKFSQGIKNFLTELI